MLVKVCYEGFWHIVVSSAGSSCL